MTERVPAVLDAVFECTLEMITDNFEDYPEIRLSFYRMIEAMNKYSFEAFLHIPHKMFVLIIDSVRRPLRTTSITFVRS